MNGRREAKKNVNRSLSNNQNVSSFHCICSHLDKLMISLFYLLAKKSTVFPPLNKSKHKQIHESSEKWPT